MASIHEVITQFEEIIYFAEEVDGVASVIAWAEWPGEDWIRETQAQVLSR